MKKTYVVVVVSLAFVFVGLLAQAQEAATSDSASVSVPRMVRFNGTAVDAQGKPISGIAGITFSIYKDQQGGAALWIETQNVNLDANGHYSVMLGATKPDGLPMELFNSGAARWVDVQVHGQVDRPRVVLLSVPYALKAHDAETIGGLPPTAFVLAAPASSASASGGSSAAGSNSVLPALTGTGTPNAIPLWTTSTDLGNSSITQVGGIVSVANKLQLPATGTASALGGKNSQPFDLLSSSFSSTFSTPITQHFRWQAEAVGNNTATPSGSLNLLFNPGSGVPVETGLKIGSNGRITFASGQTFPGTGTVRSVSLSAPTTDFIVTGSPITSAGTLAIAWNVVPTSANTANAIVKRDGSGNFAAGTITGAFSGNGAGLANVNAAALGGFAPGAYAQLAAANNFTTNQAINGNLSINGVGHGLTFPDGTIETTHQIVVPVGINDFAQQFGSPTQGKVSYGSLIPVPCWTLPQATFGTCIIATTVIPPGVTTPTVVVDVQASSTGTASVNVGSTGVAANAAPPSNCINFNTAQNLTFAAANTMQRFSTNINTLAVCGSSPPAVAGPGDILVFRICNFGATGALSFSVTSVEFLWH